MRILLTLSLLFSGLCGFAQVTITSSSFPLGGERFADIVKRFQPEKAPLVLFDTVKANMPFNIDFSMLKHDFRDTAVFVPKDDLQGGNEMTNATFGYPTSRGNAFFGNIKGNLELVGLASYVDMVSAYVALPFDSGVAYLNAPMTYGDVVVDSTFASKTVLIAQVKGRIVSSYNVNGYGKLTLPNSKTYDVVRMRRELIIQTSTTIFGNTSTEIDTAISWEFYSPDLKNSVMRVETAFLVDQNNNVLDTVVRTEMFNEEVFTGIEQELSVDDLQLNTSGDGTYVLSNFSKSDWEGTVYDLNGRAISEFRASPGRHIINLQATNHGVYLLRLTHPDGKSVTHKMLH